MTPAQNRILSLANKHHLGGPRNEDVLAFADAILTPVHRAANSLMAIIAVDEAGMPDWQKDFLKGTRGLLDSLDLAPAPTVAELTDALAALVDGGEQARHVARALLARVPR